MTTCNETGFLKVVNAKFIIAVFYVFVISKEVIAELGQNIARSILF